MASQSGPPDGLSEKKRVYDACPHCGTELSPWQKVLLSVDRALMCKQCWYRIILDAFDRPEGEGREGEPSSEQEEK